ncbi:hypothetical protein HA44_20390 [Mixta gaviniae]|nr:hypothetical protein HA44_20390 [Mixta gaviniae]
MSLQKIGWIDNLRAVACLMVIVIHTTTWYITNSDRVAESAWDLANLLNSASRVCVPLFFMISGYLFSANAARSRAIFCVSCCACCFTAWWRCSTLPR